MPGASGKRSRRREESQEAYRRRLAEARARVAEFAFSGLLPST